MNTTFKESLDKLNQDWGASGQKLKFNEMEYVIDSIMNKIDGSNPDKQTALNDLKQVKESLSQIREALTSQAGQETDTFDILPLSIKDLSDVLKILETATNGILDNAEILQKQLSSGASENEKLESISKICEHCNFQDLSGQRITRVIKNLEQFEFTTLTLFKLLIGNEAFEKRANPNSLTYNNANLMNGPEVLDKAGSQDDIDKLFSS